MSTIITLTAYHFILQDVQAFPIPAVDANVKPSCNEINQCRTTWNIVWSCLSTIALCTWVSVHPNIPNPDEEWLAMIFRRIKLMMLAIIAPEAVILWAIRQWRIATKLVKSQKSRGVSLLLYFYMYYP
jgi:hypothetical protein